MMSQHYSDPKRENETYALPDIETWQEDAYECAECGEVWPLNGGCDCDEPKPERTMTQRGAWWFWYGFPGCLPDSMAHGPYRTEAEALGAAREDVCEDEEENA
jgi:hypothetical protein